MLDGIASIHSDGLMVLLLEVSDNGMRVMETSQQMGDFSEQDRGSGLKRCRLGSGRQPSRISNGDVLVLDQQSESTFNDASQGLDEC